MRMTFQMDCKDFDLNPRIELTDYVSTVLFRCLKADPQRPAQEMEYMICICKQHDVVSRWMKGAGINLLEVLYWNHFIGMFCTY